MKENDDIFLRPDAPARFRFDDTVARVFDDMIRRSAPGYELSLSMLELLASRHAMPGSRLYDLGCSLGAATIALARGAAGRDCVVIGVDNAPAMIERAKDRIAEAEKCARLAPVRLIEEDILETEIRDASVVSLNLTLQFIPRRKRLALLRRIHAGMRAGGALLLSEKIAFHDAEENRRQIERHEAFKRAMGYSALEIARKRQALEQVLMPETLETHKRRLARAGFAPVDCWFQCFNFASLIAIKPIAAAP